MELVQFLFVYYCLNLLLSRIQQKNVGATAYIGRDINELTHNENQRSVVSKWRSKHTKRNYKTENSSIPCCADVTLAHRVEGMPFVTVAAMRK
jgi:hypothetical protein